MAFLLDTNIVSSIIREPRGPAARRLTYHAAGEVVTSIIVAGEMRYGLLRKAAPIQLARLDALLDRIPVVPLEQSAELRYAELRLSLTVAGIPIGANDLWIAAHALALGCKLVSANESEFRRVQGLEVENWLL